MRRRALAGVVFLSAVTLLAATAAGCGLVGAVQPQPSPAASPASPSIVLPGVVGKRLPEARAILAGKGLRQITLVDATGQARTVLQPNNWLVKAQHPAAGTQVTRDAPITLDVSKPTDGVGPTAVSIGTLPNVVCMELQAAQDTLQEAGFLLLSSHDALGDRRQILDRDWVVIGQSPEPGKLALPTTKVTLTVVKYAEPTGESGCRS